MRRSWLAVSIAWMCGSACVAVHETDPEPSTTDAGLDATVESAAPSADAQDGGPEQDPSDASTDADAGDGGFCDDFEGVVFPKPGWTGSFASPLTTLTRDAPGEGDAGFALRALLTSDASDAVAYLEREVDLSGPFTLQWSFFTPFNANGTYMAIETPSSTLLTNRITEDIFPVIDLLEYLPDGGHHGGKPETSSQLGFNPKKTWVRCTLSITPPSANGRDATLSCEDGQNYLPPPPTTLHSISLGNTIGKVRLGWSRVNLNTFLHHEVWVDNVCMSK